MLQPGDPLSLVQMVRHSRALSFVICSYLHWCFFCLALKKGRKISPRKRVSNQLDHDEGIHFERNDSPAFGRFEAAKGGRVAPSELDLPFNADQWILTRLEIFDVNQQNDIVIVTNTYKHTQTQASDVRRRRNLVEILLHTNEELKSLEYVAWGMTDDVWEMFLELVEQNKTLQSLVIQLDKQLSKKCYEKLMTALTGTSITKLNLHLSFSAT